MKATIILVATIFTLLIAFGREQKGVKNIAALMDAIHKVESDRGATSVNEYQLRRDYVRDVCKIRGRKYTENEYDRIAFNPAESRKAMIDYWNFYSRIYFENTGKEATYEVLARMHNGGGEYWNSRLHPNGVRNTNGYWRKVRNALHKWKVVQ